MSVAAGGRSLDGVGGEALVDEANGHRSIADRGGATFDRHRANIAHGEDTGNARLQDAPEYPQSRRPCCRDNPPREPAPHIRGHSEAIASPVEPLLGVSQERGAVTVPRAS